MLLLLAAACDGKESGGVVEPPPPPPPPVQVPTHFDANSPTNTTGVVGAQSNVVPSVRLRDAEGAAIANVMVRFARLGGGTTALDSVRTDASGNAAAGLWTFGTTAGVQTVVASTASLPPVTFSAQVAPGPLLRLDALVTTSQQAAVNSLVALAPAVRAVDQYNNAIAGTVVTFTTASGGGSILGTQKITGTDGVATADAWRLGTVPGANQARAEAALITPVTFSALAVAGPPAKLAIVSGNNASGVAGAALELYGALPVVRVTDAFDNPVAGVPVVFVPGANSGTVRGSPATTNAQGMASPTGWTLGTVVSQTLTASVASLVGVQVVFNASALVSTFDIGVRYVGFTPTTRQQLAVTRAVTKWKSVVVGTIGSSRVQLARQDCGRAWVQALDESVSNVLILINAGAIDGAGGIAADAGPCILHSHNGLTSLGTMMFDSADLATLETAGLLDAMVAHEMGHVLGVGTLWLQKNLLTDAYTTDPIFNGANTRQQFALLLSGYTGRDVPVENTGIPGSVGSHWRESVLRSELMTGVLNAGTNPLSRMTVGSLRDLGYETSYLGADAFSLAALMLAMPPSGFDWSLPNDVHVSPLFSSDAAGVRRTIIRRE
ncbi:MAG: leishmanolysin-related zinc metalloendopeptidase [Gemmatimonas sp.]